MRTWPATSSEDTVSVAVIEQGLDRKGANEFIGKWAKRFEGAKPQEGYSVTECYDLVHHKPKPEYEKVYIDVKKQLKEMGLVLA